MNSESIAIEQIARGARWRGFTGRSGARCSLASWRICSRPARCGDAARDGESHRHHLGARRGRRGGDLGERPRGGGVHRAEHSFGDGLREIHEPRDSQCRDAAALGARAAAANALDCLSRWHEHGRAADEGAARCGVRRAAQPSAHRRGRGVGRQHSRGHRVTAWRMPAFLPVFLLLVPIVAGLRHVMTERVKRYNTAFRKELEGMSAQVGGMISMIPVTRAHAVSREIARAERRFGRVREAGQAFDWHATFFGATTWVAFMLLNLGVLVAAAWYAFRGALALKPATWCCWRRISRRSCKSVMQLNAMLPVLTRGFDGLRSIGEVLECRTSRRIAASRPWAR